MFILVLALLKVHSKLINKKDLIVLPKKYVKINKCLKAC